MSRLLFVLFAGVAGLAMTSAAQAHDPPYRPSYRPGVSVNSYYRDHGRRFDHGYYYSGRNHDHWSHRRWDDRYGRYQYYDPSLRSYYYWHAPHSCYYPCHYTPCR